MPIETYTTPDFLASAGIVATDSLADQVAAALPGPAPQLVSEPLIRYGASDVDLFVDLDFDGALSGGEQATLDDVISAHLGTPNDHVRDVVSVVPGTVAVTAVDPAVDVLGGVIANPEGFAPLDVIKIRLECEIQTTGFGGFVRIVEQPSGNTIAFAALPDTSGAFESYTLQSFLDPSAGLNTYSLEANLGAASAVSIRGASLVFVESILNLTPPVSSIYLLADWASDSGAAEGGTAGKVASWSDLVAGVSPFNVTAADQPLFVAGINAGRPGLLFEGGGDALDGASVATGGTVAYNIFTSARRNVATASNQQLARLLGGAANAIFNLDSGTGEVSVFMGPNANSSTDSDTTLPGIFRLLAANYDTAAAPAGETLGRYNRVLTSFDTKPFSGSNAGALGADVGLGNNGALTAPLQGYIQRVIIVDATMPVSEETALAWYLSSLYQLP